MSDPFINAKQAWALLDLDPTEDRRAIKKAYAKKLKAIDPDKDIAHFQSLRQAMKVAEWEADRIANPQDYAHWDDWDEEEDAEAETPLDPNALIDPAAVITDDDIDAAGPTKTRAPKFEPVAREAEEAEPEPLLDTGRWDDEPEIDLDPTPQSEIQNLLWADEDQPLDEAQLKEKVRALLDDPQMDQVDHSREIEEWLGWVLVHAIPRSDSVIPMVVDHFEWQKQIGMIGSNYNFEHLVARADDVAVIERLKQPTHKWNRAYTVLTSPAPAKINFSDGWKYKTEVNALLDSLRTHNPNVEQALDADHVALWDHKAAGGPQLGEKGNTGVSVWAWLFIVWVVIKLISGLASSSSSAPDMGNNAAYYQSSAKQRDGANKFLGSEFDKCMVKSSLDCFDKYKIESEGQYDFQDRERLDQCLDISKRALNCTKEPLKP